MTVTAAQSRAARGLLDWSQADLAMRSNLSESTIRDFEKGRRVPGVNNLAAIRAALEAANVIFVAENGEGPGVRMKKERKTELTDAHIALLRQLAEKPRITTGSVPKGCKDLEYAGFCKITPVNISDLLTEITQLGLGALSEIDRRTSQMNEFDPEEIVRFGGQDVSLLTAVRKIMSVIPEQRIGVAVFRDQGKTPALFEASDIERIATLPGFAGAAIDGEDLNASNDE